MRRVPASGEINCKVGDIATVLADVERHYASAAQGIDHTDGLSIEYADWRFNLRGSNTEPVLRLNVESRGDAPLMHARTAELLQRIGDRQSDVEGKSVSVSVDHGGRGIIKKK